MKKVVIYTKDFCLWCVTAKAFFHKNKIPFEEKNIKNKEFKEELFSRTKRTCLPLIDIEGEMVIGYDRKKLRDIFGIKK